MPDPEDSKVEGTWRANLGRRIKAHTEKGIPVALELHMPRTSDVDDVAHSSPCFVTVAELTGDQGGSGSSDSCLAEADINVTTHCWSYSSFL